MTAPTWRSTAERSTACVGLKKNSIIDGRVRRTTSDDDEAERRRRRVSTSDDWWNVGRNIMIRCKGDYYRTSRLSYSTHYSECIEDVIFCQSWLFLNEIADNLNSSYEFRKQNISLIRQYLITIWKIARGIEELTLDDHRKLLPAKRFAESSRKPSPTAAYMTWGEGTSFSWQQNHATIMEVYWVWTKSKSKCGYLKILIPVLFTDHVLRLHDALLHTQQFKSTHEYVT